MRQSQLCSLGLSSCSTTPVTAYSVVPQIVSKTATLTVHPWYLRRNFLSACDTASTLLCYTGLNAQCCRSSLCMCDTVPVLQQKTPNSVTPCVTQAPVFAAYTPCDVHCVMDFIVDREHS